MSMPDGAIVTPRPCPTAAIRLIVFPFAGAGASAFYHWLDDFSDDIELGIVRLPGRESRVDATLLRDCHAAVDDIVASLVQGDSRPMAFFGHSLGALLAYETARALRHHGHSQPYLLMVSGRSAPQLPIRREPIHALPREEFFQRLLALGGMPEEVLGMPELLDFLEPVLRADLEINDRYRHVETDPLWQPLVALAGRDDRDFPEADMALWAAQTRTSFHMHAFDGGHFFINAHRAEVIALVGSYCRRYSTATPDRAAATEVCYI